MLGQYLVWNWDNGINSLLPSLHSSAEPHPEGLKNTVLCPEEQREVLIQAQVTFQSVLWVKKSLGMAGTCDLEPAPSQTHSSGKHCNKILTPRSGREKPSCPGKMGNPAAQAKISGEVNLRGQK